jgi:hypothetical protein
MIQWLFSGQILQQNYRWFGKGNQRIWHEERRLKKYARTDPGPNQGVS